MITQADFLQYLDYLNTHPAPETGRPELDCAHCGQPVEEYFVCVPGHYAETGEEVISALHLDCEKPWRDFCRKALEAN